jgi:hypothetical protein
MVERKRERVTKGEVENKVVKKMRWRKSGGSSRKRNKGDHREESRKSLGRV